MSERLNNDFFLLNGGYSNSEGSTELPRHRWYYYKEGFSPNLVVKAIEKTGVGKNELIIDPFNGSGTTTLTSSLSGHKTVGIEVNPFTSFLADTKVRNADICELEKWGNKIQKSSEKSVSSSPLIGYSTFSQNKDNTKWLFNNSVLNAFESGWQLTSTIPSYNARKIIRLALISAAMQNCNATRDGKCLRYRDTWKSYNFDNHSFNESLFKKLTIIKSDISEQPLSTKPIIINGDSRKVLNSSKSFDLFKLCITSPPYLNTFDYTDIYRPELFLGKFISRPKTLYNLRLKTVRSHVQAKWQIPTLNDFGFLYRQTMEHINANKENLMHKNIPIMIQAYFEDMFNILKLLKNHAAKDAQIWFVVSNSAYAGHEVPVDLIIGDIGTQAGWYLKEIGVLRYLKKRKTKYSTNITQLRESVIIFSNNK